MGNSCFKPQEDSSCVVKDKGSPVKPVDVKAGQQQQTVKGHDAANTVAAQQQHEAADGKGKGGAAAAAGPAPSVADPPQQQTQPVKSLPIGAVPEGSAPPGTVKPPPEVQQALQQQTAQQPYDEGLQRLGNSFASTVLSNVAPEIAPLEGHAYQVHYCGPPLPPCESDRFATIQALKSLQPLTDPSQVDAPPDPEMENILKLVANIFQTPAALVALFDDKRIFVRDSEGAFGRGDFPWRWSFCAWTMSNPNNQIMVIPDATKDARFADNHMVTGPTGVRFYCGTPLLASNGHRLGTLCFADVKPRTFDAASCMILNNLAELVVRHIEKDIALQLKQHDNTALVQAYESLKRTVDCFDHCVLLIDTQTEGWRILYANLAWTKTTGVSRDDTVNRGLGEVMECVDGQPLPGKPHVTAATSCKEFMVKNVVCRTAANKLFTLKFRPASREELDDNTLAIGVPPYVPTKPAAGGVPQAQRFYFLTVEDGSARHRNNGDPTSGSNASFIGKSAAMSIASSSEVVIEGLDIGHLLGKGAYGSVYAGTWYGTPVAVKVVDHDLRSLESNCNISLEGMLGSEMRHPHIISTLKYAIRRVGLLDPNNTYLDSHSVSGFSSTNTGHSRGAWGTPSRSSRGIHSGSSHSNSDNWFSNSERPQGLLLPMMQSGPPCTIMEAEADPLGHGGTEGSNVGPAPSAQLIEDEREGGVDSSQAHAGAAALPSQGKWAVINMNEEGDIEGLEAPSSQDEEDGHAGPKNAATQRVSGAGDSSECAPSADNNNNNNNKNNNRHKHVVVGSGSLPHNPQPAHAYQTWIVLEYCDRGCLQDAVDRGWLRTSPSSFHGGPNMAAVMATAREVASAMLFLHSRGIIHGDLSAWNVLLCSSGAAAAVGGRSFISKVADFGMARDLDIRSKVQTKNYGTLTHMPPETLRDGIVSRAVDVYSFGVLLWQMYTSSRPWAGLSHGQIIVMVVTQDAHLKFPPDTPPEYAVLATQCMAHDPAERPSFEDIVKALEAMDVCT